MLLNTPAVCSFKSYWFRIEKKVGDAVAADEVIAEIETDKTSMPVHSPTHGIIEEIMVKDGDTVKAGQPLFKLKVTAEAPKSAPKEEPKAAPAAAPPQAPPAPAAGMFSPNLVHRSGIGRIPAMSG